MKFEIYMLIVLHVDKGGYIALVQKNIQGLYNRLVPRFVNLNLV
jgi:hypothetical protein